MFADLKQRKKLLAKSKGGRSFVYAEWRRLGIWSRLWIRNVCRRRDLAHRPGTGVVQDGVGGRNCHQRGDDASNEFGLLAAVLAPAASVAGLSGSS